MLSKTLSIRKEDPSDLDASDILLWVARVYGIRCFRGGKGVLALTLNNVYTVLIM